VFTGLNFASCAAAPGKSGFLKKRSELGIALNREDGPARYMAAVHEGFNCRHKLIRWDREDITSRSANGAIASRNFCEHAERLSASSHHGIDVDTAMAFIGTDLIGTARSDIDPVYSAQRIDAGNSQRANAMGSTFAVPSTSMACRGNTRASAVMRCCVAPTGRTSEALVSTPTRSDKQRL